MQTNRLNKGGVKDLYSENCKKFTEEIKEDVSKWKDTLCSWTGKLNLVKMHILPKAIHSFDAIPINTRGIFHRNRRNHPKPHREAQKLQNSQSDLGKERS